MSRSSEREHQEGEGLGQDSVTTPGKSPIRIGRRGAFAILGTVILGGEIYLLKTVGDNRFQEGQEAGRQLEAAKLKLGLGTPLAREPIKNGKYDYYTSPKKVAYEVQFIPIAAGQIKPFSPTTLDGAINNPVVIPIEVKGGLPQVFSEPKPEQSKLIPNVNLKPNGIYYISFVAGDPYLVVNSITGVEANGQKQVFDSQLKTVIPAGIWGEVTDKFGVDNNLDKQPSNIPIFIPVYGFMKDDPGNK